MAGDGLCGYYAIFSQIFHQLYGGKILGSFNYNENTIISAKNDINYLKVNVVKPYLQNLNINWKASNNRERWNNYLNGWLSSEDIQVISNFIKRIILLIYLNNNVVQMFFPNTNNNNTLFIREDELENYSFRQVLENRGYDIELFKRGFNDESINFDLSIIDFLQKLFNLS
jgi:hypothetical protein